MTENEPNQSVYDIAIEVADEMGDSDLKDSLQWVKDYKSLQVSRANALLSEITSGLPNGPLDELASRIDSAIRKNLDSESIWEFLLLCGQHVQSISVIALDRVARTNLAKAGARAKLASDPKQADKVLVRECWEEWQRKPNHYKSKAAFARDMLEKFPNLENQTVIVRWCTEWEGES